MSLPRGRTIDDVIQFPEEAALWLGQSVDWVRKRKHVLPGVIIESREVALFHPRTYLDKRLKRGVK